MTYLENKNKICAVIPFFNESSTLNKIIIETIPFVDKLILVNDGSNDSWENEIPLSEKIILLNHSHNLGKGSTLKLGFEQSIKLNSTYTITLDADLQHDPKFIPRFIEKISEFDCVIGNRKKSNKRMPIHRKMSNYLTSKLLSLKTGIKILDSQSGFRIFKTEILNKILPDFSGFEAESEMIVKMAKNKNSIGFLEIPTIYGADNSKMKAIPAITGFLKVLFKV